MIRNALRSLPIRAGRLTGRQAAVFGASMRDGFGFFGAGPVMVIFNLPKRLQAKDPVVRTISLDEISAHFAASQRGPA